MLLHNYHTHTKRCHHATGEDRQYVETAIKNGIKTLGFSDHAPYVLPLGDTNSTHRIYSTDVDDYVHSIRSLAKEYENDIRILCGFELEYYPDYHREEMAYLSNFSPDYLILGQHFLGNERNFLLPREAKDEFGLCLYVTQVLAGLSTGDFLYLAHPDLGGYTTSPQTVEFEYRRLCEGAKKMGIPLELNLLGVREKRYYPDERFYRIAAQVGNDVIIGADAHSPEALAANNGYDEAMAMVKRTGVRLVTEPLL